jgi:tetratricopeptide (TPR) repeat protein
MLLLLTAGGLRAAESPSAGSSASPAVAGDFERGKRAVEDKDYKAASGYFRTALKSQPDNPDVLNMLAFSERKQGNLEVAFNYYAKALTLRPHFPEAREYLAEAHLQAALKEFHTLQQYGAEGKEEAEELAQKFRAAVNDLK